MDNPKVDNPKVKVFSSPALVPDGAGGFQAAPQGPPTAQAKVHVISFKDRLLRARQRAHDDPPPVVVDFMKLYSLPGTFLGGEVVLFIGDTGLGKSSVWQNIGYLIGQPEFAPTGTPVRVLDCSMEMTEDQHARRYLQIAHGLRVSSVRRLDEVTDVLKDPSIADEDLYGPLGHLAFESVESSPLTVDDVEERARDHGAGLVVMDTLEAFRPSGRRSYSSSYEQFEALCREIKAMAARLNALVVVVHHLHKAGQETASGGGTLQIHHGKGPAIASQVFDFMMTFTGDRNDVSRKLALIKWRRFQQINIVLIGEPETLRFAPPQ